MEAGGSLLTKNLTVLTLRRATPGCTPSPTTPSPPHVTLDAPNIDRILGIR
jgi:hypothetical protein